MHIQKSLTHTSCLWQFVPNMFPFGSECWDVIDQCQISLILLNFNSQTFFIQITQNITYNFLWVLYTWKWFGTTHYPCIPWYMLLSFEFLMCCCHLKHFSMTIHNLLEYNYYMIKFSPYTPIYIFFNWTKEYQHNTD